MNIISCSQALIKYNIDESNYIHDSCIFIETVKDSGIKIGKNNVIGPGCVIWLGTGYRNNTILGSDNYIGAGSTIKPDVILGNNNILDASVFLGLQSCIQDNAKLESFVSISEYSTIGSYSYIGTLTPVIKDVLPFSKVFGNPASLKGINTTKLMSETFSEHQLKEIRSFLSSDIEPEDIMLISIIDNYINQARKKPVK